MSQSAITPNDPFVCQFLKEQVAGLMAIYCFGDRSQGTETTESDLDLAVLTDGYMDPVHLWDLAGELAGELDMDVDLLDLRAASTVMQYQVITTGQRLWARDIDVEYFELFVLNEKLDLDRLRQPILDQIREEGQVYGR